jgi:hypothetical protein
VLQLVAIHPGREVVIVDSRFWHSGDAAWFWSASVWDRGKRWCFCVCLLVCYRGWRIL